MYFFFMVLCCLSKSKTYMLHFKTSKITLNVEQPQYLLYRSDLTYVLPSCNKILH